MDEFARRMQAERDQAVRELNQALGDDESEGNNNEVPEGNDETEATCGAVVRPKDLFPGSSSESEGNNDEQPEVDEEPENAFDARELTRR